MRNEIGDRGWWLDSSDLTAEAMASRIVTVPQSGLGFGARFGMGDGAARSEARTRAGCAGGAGALIE